MTKIVIMLAAICAAFYLLYINGYVVTQMKKAVMYVESMKGRKASFSFCSGYTKRMVRFKESKTYHFAFAPELSKGEVSVELLDSGNNKILCLSSGASGADIDLDAKSKYYLVVRFEGASGKYVLNWD